jgi:hypothetical protein
MSFMMRGTQLEREYGVTQHNRSSKFFAIGITQLICALLLAAHPALQQRGKPREQPLGTAGEVNPKGAAVKGFLDRVNAYVDLQKKAESDIPKLNGDETPSQIEAHQAAMSARMKLARPNAKRGEIFGDAEPIFKAAVAEDKALRTKRDEKAVMEEVPKFDPPKVNAAYPEKLALATVPPLLLDQFPRLPEGRLEYRFMGNDLVMRDVKANLIADFINNAAPPAVPEKR